MEFNEYGEFIHLYIDGIEDEHIKVYKSNILSSPSRNIEFLEVQGRNGSLTIDHGDYSDFILELECAIVANNDEEMKIVTRNIKNMLLKCINKKIQTSEDLDFYLIGTYNNKVDIEEILEGFGKCLLTFRCKPFRQSVNENILTLTKATNINNAYLECYPQLKIFGIGDITISINNQKLILKAIEDYIIVDSEVMNAFKEDKLTKEIINQNQKMFSDFPTLEEGNNSISWAGNVTKIEVLPRWAVI